MLSSLQNQFNEIQDAVVFAFAPPIRGLGVRGGFEMQVEDRGDMGLDELHMVQSIVEAAQASPGLRR